MDPQAALAPASDAGACRVVSGAAFSSALAAQMHGEQVDAFFRLAWPRLLPFAVACLLLAAWMVSGAHTGALGAASILALGAWVGSLAATPAP